MPGCHGRAQRRGTEPRLGGSGGPGVVIQRSRNPGAEGVWKSMVKTEAGTGVMNFDTCKHFGMAGVTGACGSLWVLTQKPGHRSLRVKLRV